MKIRLLTVLVLCSVIFSSCKKEDKSTPDTLTSKIWKRGSTDRDPSTNPPGKVIYYSVKNCEKDDSFQFNPDGKMTLNRGKNKCVSSESRIAHQKYTLDRATKEFTINGTKYTLAEESGLQIKYYAEIPAETGYQYLIFLLQ